ncbi:MAG: deoxyribose-phosphate aldolase [Nitriliruptoraceae bacterium]
MDRQQLSPLIDHTLLKPEATAQQIEQLCEEAVEHGFASVCVSPTHVALVARRLDGHRSLTCSVIGFPSGAHLPPIKAAEAARAVADGAQELDMVIDLGALSDRGGAAVEQEVAAVRAEVADAARIKVIIESAALSDQQIVMACESAVAAGADFVKTSTGFHPSGGASTHAVALMRRTVGAGIGVKASGGIRSYQDAVAMLEAGASRLGMSAGVAVVTGG